jgi:hypothetical protein
MVALTSKFFLYKSMAKEKIRMLILRKKKPDTSLLIAGMMRIYVINVLSRHMELF